MNLSTLKFNYVGTIQNTTPTADAGGNKAQSKNTKSITLDGSNSTAGQLGYINYQWSQIYGPSVLFVDDKQIEKPTFTGLIEGTYKLRLTVFDSLNSDYNEVLIWINDGSNILPTAKLTQPQNNQTFIEGQIIPISATANDADGKISRVEFWINNELNFVDSAAPFENYSILKEGNYSISAIAYDDSNSSVNTEVANIQVFSVVGDWKLAPKAGALGVGPSKGNPIWWSNTAADLNTRNCLFDDIYKFDSSGKFENILGENTWLEGWQNNGTEACGTPIAPHDGMTAGTWHVDSIDGSIILNGKGLYLGLPKATNSGELSNSNNVPEQRIYEAELNSTTLTAGIDYGNGYWNFEFVKIEGQNSIKNKYEDKINIYPNPATDNLNVVCNKPIKSVQIIDVTGRILIYKDNINTPYSTISISQLTTGAYYIIIHYEGGINKTILIHK